MKEREKDTGKSVDRLGTGRKIRELRRKKNYSVEDLAEKIDVAKAVLEKIENDAVVPPLGTLLKLSRTLDVSMAYFFDEEVEVEKIFITRKSGRTRVKVRPFYQEGQVDYFFESLEPRNPNKHIEPFLVIFQPMEASDILFMSHKGEEFHYVLEGSLEFRTDDRVEVLEPGDSLFFESEMNHGFRALAGEPATVIVVVWSRPGG
jgi:transcriptional regulator with XRE-family HTH domain